MLLIWWGRLHSNRLRVLVLLKVHEICIRRLTRRHLSLHLVLLILILLSIMIVIMLLLLNIMTWWALYLFLKRDSHSILILIRVHLLRIWTLLIRRVHFVLSVYLLSRILVWEFLRYASAMLTPRAVHLRIYETLIGFKIHLRIEMLGLRRKEKIRIFPTMKLWSWLRYCLSIGKLICMVYLHFRRRHLLLKRWVVMILLLIILIILNNGLFVILCKKVFRISKLSCILFNTLTAVNLW